MGSLGRTFRCFLPSFGDIFQLISGAFRESCLEACFLVVYRTVSLLERFSKVLSLDEADPLRESSLLNHDDEQSLTLFLNHDWNS